MAFVVNNRNTTNMIFGHQIKRISHRNVPADYQVAMKEDSVLVMMALQQDVNNQQKSTSLVYVSVSPDNKVRERYRKVRGGYARAQGDIVRSFRSVSSAVITDGKNKSIAPRKGMIYIVLEEVIYEKENTCRCSCGSYARCNRLRFDRKQRRK